jgi:uncharacterized protein YjiS (DUF1127 family)
MTTATSFPTTFETLVYGATSRGSFLDRIRAAIRAANARRQERDDYDYLLGCEDHILNDIGLSREDVSRAREDCDR